MTRPLVRHWCGWWRIFIGHSHHTLHNHYYTTNTRAHDAAQRLAGQHREAAKRNSLA